MTGGKCNVNSGCRASGTYDSMALRLAGPGGQGAGLYSSSLLFPPLLLLMDLQSGRNSCCAAVQLERALLIGEIAIYQGTVRHAIAETNVVAISSCQSVPSPTTTNDSARAPFSSATHSSTKQTGAALTVPHAAAQAVSLSSAHLTIVNRFHDAQRLSTAANGT
ncbi:hypothetical protein SVAN01_05263 [Stagonosporopsis vannaccii]|nr:hypothetical protein SVAN01_05263 [Stagonosporopsis vannaccii]